jgi:polysaccharide biosynthesis/export protein
MPLPGLRSIRRVSSARFHDRRQILALLALGVAGSACSSGGRYVWYTALPRAEWGAPPPEYVIGVGDVLTVKVYEQEGLSGTLKVRSDGRVAVALIGEVVAAGKHPSAFASELEAQLKRFILSPRVTVNVEQAQPVTITVVGEVKTGGTIALEAPPLLLQALAKSGGLTEFADDERIFVIRQLPVFRRIRFTYKAIVNNENGAAGFILRTGDVVVVE